MADNLDITPGTGATVATDDIGSAHYQKIKVALGADGAVDGLLDAGQQAMAASLPVVIASDQSAVAVTVGAALPAGTNNIGDVDVASLPALAAGTNSIGGAKDNGAHWTSSFGVTGARFTSANASAADVAVTDAPTSGQKLVITDVLISVDTAMLVDLKEETSATVLASLYLPANGSAQFTPRSNFKLATADKKLMVRTSASGNIAVTAFYRSEA